MAEVSYLPQPEPAASADIPRTVRRNVERPIGKPVDHDIPIPAWRPAAARVTYPWFREVKRAGDSFFADTEQEVAAFRRYGYKHGWRAIVRIDGDGWRCWRGWGGWRG